MQVIPIESIDDPRIALYRNVRDAHLVRVEAADGQGFFIAEGELVVRQLFASRFEVHSVLLTPTRYETTRDLFADDRNDPPVYMVPQSVMDAVVGFHIHRGILAAGVRPRPASISQLLTTAGPLLLLEDLANHDNIGGLFRVAAAFGVTAVLVSPRCADPLYRKSLRVSMGHALTVPFATSTDWQATLRSVGEAGFVRVALSPSGSSQPLSWLARTPRSVAVLVGAEGPGLAESSLAISDMSVRIPMTVATDSLNVCVAAGIALHRLTERKLV